MSSAGHVANLSGWVARPRAREIGLIGFAAQIQRSSLTGSYVMETAEHREPCESRGSRTVLGARGGESPSRDSTFASPPHTYDVSSSPEAEEAAACAVIRTTFLQPELPAHPVLDPSRTEARALVAKPTHGPPVASIRGDRNTT